NVTGERIGCRRWEFSKPAGCDLETPDSMIGLIGKPDVAIGPGGNTDAHPEKGELILRDDSIRRDRSNLAGRAFTEPDVTVWPRRDECRIAQARRPGVLDISLRTDASDFAAIRKSEPKLAVLAHRDRERLGASKDREAFARRRLGSNAACREGERGEAADKLEMKLTPGKDEDVNGAPDEVKTRYHKVINVRAYLRIAKCNRLHRCNL